MSPKMGRPKIEKPKSNVLKARFDDETYNQFMQYCRNVGSTPTIVLREIVTSFLNDNKK